MEERPRAELLSTGISRRETLRRIGAIGAVTWSAPLLSKVPAFAQTGTPVCERCAVGGRHCPSGTVQPYCGGGQTCSCLQTAAGDCFCHQRVNCGHPRVRACTTDAQCDPGWRCARSCCAGGALLCHPPCGTAVTAVGTAATAQSGMSTG